MSENKIGNKTRGIEELKKVLQLKIAYFTGGLDNESNKIILVDLRNYTCENDLKINMNFLLSLKRKEDYFVTIILDSSQSSSKLTKNVVKQFMVFFTKIIRSMYVIKPENFWQRKLTKHKLKNCLRNANFKIFLVKLENLENYIEKDGLLKSLEGNLQFDHNEWMEKVLVNKVNESKESHYNKESVKNAHKTIKTASTRTKENCNSSSKKEVSFRLHKIRHKSEADLLSVKNVTTTQEGQVSSLSLKRKLRRKSEPKIFRCRSTEVSRRNFSEPIINNKQVLNKFKSIRGNIDFGNIEYTFKIIENDLKKVQSFLKDKDEHLNVNVFPINEKNVTVEQKVKNHKQILSESLQMFQLMYRSLLSIKTVQRKFKEKMLLLQMNKSSVLTYNSLKNKTDKIYETVEMQAEKFKECLRDRGKCLQLAYELQSSENSILKLLKSNIVYDEMKNSTKPIDVKLKQLELDLKRVAELMEKYKKLIESYHIHLTKKSSDVIGLSGATKQELESFQSKYKSLELKHKEFEKIALKRKNNMKHEQTFQNAIKQCVVSFDRLKEFKTNLEEIFKENVNDEYFIKNETVQIKEKAKIEYENCKQNLSLLSVLQSKNCNGSSITFRRTLPFSGKDLEELWNSFNTDWFLKTSNTSVLQNFNGFNKPHSKNTIGIINEQKTTCKERQNSPYNKYFETNLVLPCLNSNDRLRIQEWTGHIDKVLSWLQNSLLNISKDKFELGKNLHDAQQMFDDHELFYKNLHESRNKITSLLSVSVFFDYPETQVKLFNEKSKSLKHLWREINYYSSIKNSLLESSVTFYNIFEKLDKKMICMENYLKWDSLPKEPTDLKHLILTVENMYEEIKKMLKLCTSNGKTLKQKLMKLSTEDKLTTYNSFRRSISKIDCMLASVFEREKHLDTKFKKRVKQLQDDLKIKQWIQNSQKENFWFTNVLQNQISVSSNNEELKDVYEQLTYIKPEVNERYENLKSLLLRGKSFKPSLSEEVFKRSANLDKLGEKVITTLDERIKVVKENIQYNTLVSKFSGELKVFEQELKNKELFEDYYSAVSTIKWSKEKEGFCENLRKKVEELGKTKKSLLENRSFKHDISIQKLKELKSLLKKLSFIIQEKKSLASSFVDYFQLCNQVLLEIDKIDISRAVKVFSDNIKDIHDKVKRCSSQSFSLISNLENSSTKNEKHIIKDLIRQINALYFEISSRAEFIFKNNYSMKYYEKMESKVESEKLKSKEEHEKSQTRMQSSSSSAKKTSVCKRNYKTNTNQCNADSQKEDNNYLCINTNKEKHNNNNYLCVNVNKQGDINNDSKRLVVKDVNLVESDKEVCF